MTNYIETIQSQGECDEVNNLIYSNKRNFNKRKIDKELNKYRVNCFNDTDCQNIGSFMNTWNGIRFFTTIF